MGADGKDGKDADESWRPLSIADCHVALDIVSVVNGTLTTQPDGLQESALHATIMIYTNGDVDVSCGVALGTAQEGSSSQYLIAGTVGARNRSCLASADYPSPNGMNGGFWEFTGIGGVMQAQYNDADNPLGLDGKAYTFTAADCVARVMDADGTWSDSTLAAVL